MCEAQNAVNPNGFTSIRAMLQRKIRVSKSDSSLNALASLSKYDKNTNEVFYTIYTKILYHTSC